MGYSSRIRKKERREKEQKQEKFRQWLNGEISFLSLSFDIEELRESDHELLGFYELRKFNWRKVKFQTKGMKIDDRSFPLIIADRSWNDKINIMKAIAPDGVECHLWDNGRIVSVLNLDDIIGVGLDIFKHYNNRKVQFKKVTDLVIIHLIKDNQLSDNKIECLKHLIQSHNRSFRKIAIIESIVNVSSNISYLRTTLIFTLKSENSDLNYVVLESIDENTATYIFSPEDNDILSYFMTLSHLRNYFQGNIENKRERSYDESYLFEHHSLIRHRALQHRDFLSWKKNLESSLK